MQYDSINKKYHNDEKNKANKIKSKKKSFNESMVAEKLRYKQYIHF